MEFATTVLLGKVDVSEADFEAVIRNSEFNHWYLWQFNGDYIDIEGELTIKDATDNSEQESICVHVTLSPLEQRNYIMLGNNPGHGFDTIIELDKDLKTTVAKISKEHQRNLVTENQAVYEQLILEATLFSNRFPWVLFT